MKDCPNKDDNHEQFTIFSRSEQLIMIMKSRKKKLEKSILIE